MDIMKKETKTKNKEQLARLNFKRCNKHDLDDIFLCYY